jgi:SAM-dependent methyltransferase
MASEKGRYTSTIRKLRFVDNSDVAWREFGKDDPYFGVLTEDKFRKKNLTAETLKQFFDSGESHVSDVLTVLREHVTPSLALGDALDFGCGVGRLILPMTSRFGRVAGIDISEAYRAEALSNCVSRNIANVEFLETLQPLMEEGRRFDLVHSCIVFNHIAWGRGKDLITQLFELLRPGGAMAVQVMLRCQSTAFRRAGSWARRNFLPINWIVNLARGRRAFEPLMQGNEYPLHELLPLLKAYGAGDFHVRLDTTPEGHVFAFIFCIKKAPGAQGTSRGRGI